jgi:hypothetical protein
MIPKKNAALPEERGIRGENRVSRRFS